MIAVDPVRQAPHHASSADSVETALELFLDQCSRPCRILIALSGGGDSVGLTTALSRIHARKPASGFQFITATVDHGLRAESQTEAETAGRLAMSLGIQHTILNWAGDKPKTGLQAAAREARYGLLARHALDEGAELILTGHNLDDNIETLQMRQARTADPDAHGMAEAVLLSGRIWAARPLLGLRRETIRAYLRDQGVSWADDPSNANPVFERVRLRSAVADGSVPDFALLMRKRQARMNATAAFLATRAAVLGLKVGVVDLTGVDVADPALLDGLAALAAVLGGREHGIGLEAREALLCYLRAGEGQMTAGRVVFDRRGDRLYLQREKRGLPTMIAPAGAAVIWDSRLRIVNSGQGDLEIGVGPEGQPLIDPDLLDGLPARVRQLALSAGPFIKTYGANRPDASAFLPGCDKFLPLERLELGNVLAKLMGLPHFPTPIFRLQA